MDARVKTYEEKNAESQYDFLLGRICRQSVQVVLILTFLDRLKSRLLWNTYTNPAGCQCFCTRSKNDSDCSLGKQSLIK